MLKKPLSSTRKILAIYVLFGISAIYVFQARLFEKPSVQVNHFAAGAGSLGLCLLYPLAYVISMYHLNKLSKVAQANKMRLLIFIHLVMIALPIILAVSVHLGLERRAPQYDRVAFENLVASYEGGTSITKDFAIEKLGVPVSQEKIGGREVWSYTYMPSTGIGWHKRILIFDDKGEMIGFTNMDE